MQWVRVDNDVKDVLPDAFDAGKNKEIKQSKLRVTLVRAVRSWEAVTSSGKQAAQTGQTASLELAEGRPSRNQPDELPRNVPGINIRCRECWQRCTCHLSSGRCLLPDCWVCRFALQSHQDPDGWQQQCLGLSPILLHAMQEIPRHRQGKAWRDTLTFAKDPHSCVTCCR